MITFHGSWLAIWSGIFAASLFTQDMKTGRLANALSTLDKLVQPPPLEAPLHIYWAAPFPGAVAGRGGLTVASMVAGYILPETLSYLEQFVSSWGYRRRAG